MFCRHAPAVPSILASRRKRRADVLFILDQVATPLGGTDIIISVDPTAPETRGILKSPLKFFAGYIHGNRNCFAADRLRRVGAGLGSAQRRAEFDG